MRWHHRLGDTDQAFERSIPQMLKVEVRASTCPFLPFSKHPDARWGNGVWGIGIIGVSSPPQLGKVVHMGTPASDVPIGWFVRLRRVHARTLAFMGCIFPIPTGRRRKSRWTGCKSDTPHCEPSDLSRVPEIQALVVLDSFVAFWYAGVMLTVG